MSDREYHCETAHGEQMSIAASSPQQAAKHMHATLWKMDWAPMTHSIVVVDPETKKFVSFESRIVHEGPMKREDVKPEHFEVIELPVSAAALERNPAWTKYAHG